MPHRDMPNLLCSGRRLEVDAAMACCRAGWRSCGDATSAVGVACEGTELFEDLGL
jgi:hypothetical protein